MRWLTSLTIALAVLAVGGVAAARCAPEQGQILLLGVHHFVSTENLLRQGDDDELSPQRQREIEDVVGRLARFKADVIAVERPYDQAELDRRYAAFRAGAYQLTAEETDQIGFRLAQALGHERLVHVQYKGEFPFDAVAEFAALNGREDEVRRATEDTTALLEELDQRLRAGGMLAALRYMNDPAVDARNHQAYIALNRLANTRDPQSGERPGPELVAQWWRTNLNLFTNLQNRIKPGERMLVIYGQGHARILRDLIAADPQLCPVSPLRYLR